MDNTAFWELLEHSRHETADQDERTEWLTGRLAGLAPRDVVDFQVHVDLVRARIDTWPLWGAAYLIGDGCSDDGFHYFQGWVIGLGRDAVERAAADPDSLADVDWSSGEIPEWEELDLVAPEAYRQLTGEPEGLHEALTARGHQVRSTTSGEDWDFDDAEETTRRLPRLSAALRVAS
jgi:hypothetical protein